MKLFKKVSFKRIVMPFTGEKTENVGEGFYYNSQQYVHYSGLEHSETAFFRLSGLQIVIVLLLIVICGLGLLSSFLFTLQLLVGLAVVFYFTDLLYNLYLILKSFANNFELNQGSNLYLLRSNWPMYTILCPLYKEWSVLPQFIKAMTSLEYPKDKLQVMIFNQR
jgi:hypothetical protein